MTRQDAMNALAATTDIVVLPHGYAGRVGPGEYIVADIFPSATVPRVRRFVQRIDWCCAQFVQDWLCDDLPADELWELAA